MTTFFPYAWTVDPTEIQVYGFSGGKTTCLRLQDFTPYVYVKLPTTHEWTIELLKALERILEKWVAPDFFFKCCLMHKKPLYYATKQLHPYLFIAFHNDSHRRRFSYAFRESVTVLGMKCTLHLYEQNATPILQLTSIRNIPTASWFTFTTDTLLEQKVTTCDREYVLNWKQVSPIKDAPIETPHPLILSFDLEANSHDPTKFCNSDHPEDKVFQISMVFAQQGSPESEWAYFLLTLGNPIGVGCTVLKYKTEAQLLLGFVDLIQKKQPHIITGYNIYLFDLPYLLARAKLLFIYDDFVRIGFTGEKSAERTVKWSSSAYKHQEMTFLDAKGRLFIDLYPLVMRDFNFESYKLDFVAGTLLNASKDPLTAQDIFLCYRLGMKDPQSPSEALGTVGKYCVKDSVLVLQLFEKLQYWYGLSEMATVCNIPIASVYLYGQQVRVFSQVYKYCFNHNIVVESGAYQVQPNEHFQGAYVHNPVPGLYDNVVPLDFCLTGDTLITLANGTSRRIDQLVCDTDVYSWTDCGFDADRSVNGLQHKGKKSVLKIFFKDGHVLRCTPDHKVMLDSGEWCEAQYLLGKTVKCGIEYPEDVLCPLEQHWRLETPTRTFTMDTEENRASTLAFVGLLGFILSDGSIYKDSRSKQVDKVISAVSTGTLVDANQIMRDLLLLVGKQVAIRKQTSTRKGTTFLITFPVTFSKYLTSMEGLVIGKRATQAMTLPSFLLVPGVPTSVIKRFLGGLFGGDGSAPNINLKRETMNTISFRWTTVEKHIESMRVTMEQIRMLLSKVGVRSNVHTSLKVKYGSTASMLPKDHVEHPRWDTVIMIQTESIQSFAVNVGFLYAINKAYRLSVAKSYLDMKDYVRQQYMWVVDRSNELSSARSDQSLQQCVLQARLELYAREPVWFHSNLPTKDDVSYCRGELVRHFDKPRKLSLHKKKFPTIVQYIEEISEIDWWMRKQYLVTQDVTYIPSIHKEVMAIVEETEPVDVYDIEVKRGHNFLANGAVVHNCSLYPSLIIGHNIDYSTIVNDPHIPDSKCTIIEWEEHINCGHLHTEINPTKERMCGSYRYRFLKDPKGILPTIIQNTLSARKEVRTHMKSLDKTSFEYSIMDKRQLAYKVVANSIYGSMGVQKGYLPFMPGAMAVTASGRQAIQKVVHLIQTEHQGKNIYNDTDSALVTFPHLTNAQDVWTHAIEVSKAVSLHFPKPMYLEFEETIYWRFLVLTKKRYMTISCDEHGVISDKITNKGVLLKRRDTAKIVRIIYEKLVFKILHRRPESEIFETLREQLNLLCSGAVPLDNFVITKSVGNIDQLRLSTHTETKHKYGDYIVPILHEDTKEKLLVKKGASTADEFYQASLPGPVQLALKMRARGQPISSGSRVSYVITRHGGMKARMSEKMEEFEYFQRHHPRTYIEQMYYMKSLVNPLDELLYIIYGTEKYIKKWTDAATKYNQVVNHLNTLYTPIIKF
jgi:DNA polymerase elongation subunit (family B)